MLQMLILKISYGLKLCLQQLMVKVCVGGVEWWWWWCGLGGWLSLCG